MRRFTLSPLICALLLVFFSLSSASHLECGVYEEEVECVDSCNFCNENRPCPKTQCVQGCDCIPGFSRNSLGDCIPRQYCDEDSFGVTEQLSPISGVGKRGNLLGFSDGCPNEDFCTVSCIQRNFKSGICLGPGKRNCNCYSYLPNEKDSKPIEADDEPAKPPHDHGCPKNPKKCADFCRSQSQGTKTGVCDSNICRCCIPGVINCPRIEEDPLAQITAGDEEFESSKHKGCPKNPSKCKSHCLSEGGFDGICVGKHNKHCECLYVLDSGVDKRGNLLGISDGCPSNKFCTVSCIKRMFKSGLCMGPKNGYCNCFSKLPNEKVPKPADDAPVKTPNDHGCPNVTACIRHCKKVGFGTGTCDGKDCHCHFVPPGVDASPKVDEETADDDRKAVNRQGCPRDPSACKSFCKSRDYETGICTGNRKTRCGCVDFL